MPTAILVGAGPGDPKLLTLAAFEALQQCDVVLCDRLIASSILELIPDHVEKIYVGKEMGGQERIQAEIFGEFIRYAVTNKTIVRLKGGDPFVFGRGIEELVVLEELGYVTRLIPGVSSSIAVPALAGIPVTARGIARSFAVLTGHCAEDDSVDWSAYSKVDTLVILMGVSNRQMIAERLIEAGRNPFEPIAFIENGSLPQQNVLVADLREVADGKVDATAPAIFIVGKVVALSGSVVKESNQLLDRLRSGSDCNLQI